MGIELTVTEDHYICLYQRNPCAFSLFKKGLFLITCVEYVHMNVGAYRAIGSS